MNESMSGESYRTGLKMILDIILSGLLAAIFLIPFLFVLLGCWVDTGAPFYVQQRNGKDGRSFRIFKLKTMRDGVGKEKKVSGFGRLVRLSGIDELPQLANVLRGEMSLIGPRPLLLEYQSLFTDSQKIRFTIKPGITGLSQVLAGNDAYWSSKLRFDQLYCLQMSLWLDLYICVLTARRLFKAVLGFKTLNHEGYRFDR